MLKKIFSKSDYNETHYILRVFGLKIKYPKPEFARKYKELPYNNYLKNKIDITTLPKASGQFREIQLANLALLNELDYVCKQAGLTYWIDFGTILGAVRHKGFIPWDDDIDVGMPRADYERLIEAFNKFSRNLDIFADFFRCNNNSCQIIIKVQHKKCHQLFVDIFPYDFYPKDLEDTEQLDETKWIKNIRKDMQKESSFSDDNDKVLALIDRYRQNLNISKEKSSNTLIWGIEFNHNWKNWFVGYETIFPLKEIEFEKQTFPCVNNKEKYLTKVYGNYMGYPKKIGYGHNMFANFTEEEKSIIKDLINDKEML